MKDALINLFSQPIVIGLSLGLTVALIVFIRGTYKRIALKSQADAKQRELRAEIENLRKHLHTQMEITSKGNEAVQQEVIELKKINNNLSLTIGALKQKPGRSEIRTLHLYEKAIRIMNSRAPGFGPVWESAIVDAEAELKKEESGILGWIRKPFLTGKSDSKALDIQSD